MFKALKNTKAYNNTFVFLTADNGYESISYTFRFSLTILLCMCTHSSEGYSYNLALVLCSTSSRPDLMQGIRGGSAGPLRCGKASTWEGGFREPGIAWWPNKIRHGRTHQVRIQKTSTGHMPSLIVCLLGWLVACIAIEEIFFLSYRS